MESVPSVFIITVIWVSAGGILSKTPTDNPWIDGSLANIIYNAHPPSQSPRIFGLSPGRGNSHIEFFATYFISVTSAALGLAKCLKNGVARPIAPGGPLDGLLTGKFLAALGACAEVLMLRGGCIALSPVINGIKSGYNISIIRLITLMSPVASSSPSCSYFFLRCCWRFSPL